MQRILERVDGDIHKGFRESHENGWGRQKAAIEVEDLENKRKEY